MNVSAIHDMRPPICLPLFLDVHVTHDHITISIFFVFQLIFVLPLVPKGNNTVTCQ